MTDPTTVAPPVSPAKAEGPKADAQKPTKALPSDRVSMPTALKILGAYGALAGAEPKSAAEIGDALKIHPSSISVCNPFFIESGLAERIGSGLRAGPEVVAYHRALDWEAATAGEQLAPALRNAWFWKALQPRLSVRSLEEAEAVRVLAEECRAGASYRPQIRLILDYLSVAGLIAREGTQIRKGKLFSPDGATGTMTPAPAFYGGGPVPEVVRPPLPEQVPVSLTVPLISFDVSIRLTEADIAGWAPEQTREFFAGLAAVIGAKSRLG